MRWTRQRRRARQSQGGFIRERAAGAQTNGAKSGLVKASVGVHYPPKQLTKTGCVRQNCVVLAPVAGVKSAEVFASPTGRDKTFNPPMTVTRRIRRRGERGISRKTIAQGMPECLR
jgi:hypothetical protein